MMRLRKTSFLLMVGSIGFATVFMLFGPLGLTGTAQAAPEMILVTSTGTDPIQYMDPSGNIIGEGVYVGELRCIGDNCTQKMEFEPPSPGSGTASLVHEYKFRFRQAFDPVAEIVVVSGVGTISDGGSKSRFSFTGVFQNNGDGTIRVAYTASMPEASFIFPTVPGTFSVNNN